ncbi:MAG: diguanylate cyclase [Actinobacteria bacterium]|nr:diguanylate cyclase [Actinomycetota bacterium]
MPAIIRQEQKPAKHPYRILVAEDSPTQQRIIKTVLSREGFDVVIAGDGIEAVTQAFQENPDLVVLDIEMPRMDGYQVCRLLKDDYRTSRTPVIMLTSKSQETDKFWGLQTGADRYVTKDFQLTGLAGAVRELLGGGDKDGDAPARCNLPKQPAVDQQDVDVLSRVNELLDRKLYEATVINEISKLNTLSENCALTVSSVLTVIAKVTDCPVCSIMLVEESELIIHVHGPVGNSYFEEARRQAIGAASPYMKPGTASTQIEVVVDSDPSFIREDRPEFDGIKSMLVIPLQARGQKIAILILSSPRPDAFAEATQRLLEIIEYPVSLVVDNARLHEGTRRLAITDGLTRLFNHRHFYELLEQEFQRAVRYESQLSLIMADIDSFKKINDAHGHQVGDEILTQLAGVISREVRDMDIVARYGGEEIAVLLPQTGPKQACEVATRIRGAVENYNFHLPDGGNVTLSLGVAGFPECGASNYAGLVQVADAALYEAKKTGKNRVVAGGNYEPD